MKIRRKKIIWFAIALVLLWVLRPVFFLTWVYFTDHPKKAQQDSPIYVNDASGLNRTKIDSLVILETDSAKAILQIQSLIQYAAQTNKKISIAGSSHSMGGHTITANGIMIKTSHLNFMHLDTINNLLTVGAGATWKEVIAYLNHFHRSVIVMQSNNSFSVGGSVSVNCHGWQPFSGPISSTIEEFECITADGKIHVCSRENEPQLFRAMIGGYGLFGLITEVVLRVAPNEKYKLQQHVIATENYPAKFQEQKKNGNAGLMYGRLCVAPNNFLNEAILTIFEKTGLPADDSLHQPGYQGMRRVVFRGSANSKYGKNLRWRLEKYSTKLGKGMVFNRNDLMNEGVEIYENTSENYTDILHEYFIPQENFGVFINMLKTIIPKHKVDLMNITIRDVAMDTLAYLNYSHTDVFGFVMLFNQKKDEAGEKEMKSLTNDLINAALKCKGTYYLPYRLHATKEQLYQAYPQIQNFFLLKKKFDSKDVFSNNFYETYKSSN